MMIRRRRVRRRTKARAGILLLLALALVVPSTVQAVSPPGSDDGGFGTPSAAVPSGGGGGNEEAPSSPIDPVARFAAGEISEALREQLTWQAEQEGISLDKAIEKYAWQGPLAYLVNEIRQDYPDDFAGARIEEDLTAWVAFSGAAPAGAASSIRAFPRAVQIIENRGFTEADLRQRLNSVHNSVIGNDNIDTAASTYDIGTGLLTVEVVLKNSESTPEEKTSMLDLLQANLPVGSVASTGTNKDVLFNIVTSTPGGGDEDVTGGMHLSTCTVGFVLEHTSGRRHISTAGHCGNNQRLIDGSIYLRLGWGIEHQGEWGDLQRHSVPSGYTLVNEFRYDSGPNGYQFVESTGVPMEGQWLRKYGKSSGYTVDRVYRGSVYYPEGRKLVAMHNRKARGGDSGGPWFHGTTAYGIHSGNWIFGLKRRDLFTPVHHIDDAFPGWTVATS